MKRERIEVGAIVVENGPARKRAIATKELLDNQRTAPHYQVGLRDSLGKPIRLGQPMDYLDYLGEWVWYVYEPLPVMIDKRGAPIGPLKPGEEKHPQCDHLEERFWPVGVEATKDEAIALARRKRWRHTVNGFFGRN